MVFTVWSVKEAVIRDWCASAARYVLPLHVVFGHTLQNSMIDCDVFTGNDSKSTEAPSPKGGDQGRCKCWAGKRSANLERISECMHAADHIKIHSNSLI